MKVYFVPLFAVLYWSCASPRQDQTQVPIARAISVGSALSQETRNSLRRPEVVKGYPMGRYVDSNSGRVMHEKHMVYRLEEDANWNLRNDTNRGIYSTNEANFRRPEKSYDINHEHFSALAEQNAVLEKKVYALESEHARCASQHLNQHSQNAENRAAISVSTAVHAVTVPDRRALEARSLFSKDTLVAPCP